MWITKCLFALSVTALTKETEAMPFLYPQTITSFISSASAASSASDQSDNIADLRQKKEPISRVQRIVATKYRDDNDFSKVSEEPTAATNQENQNEVIPDLLQKKVAKILQKIQFFYRVKNTICQGNGASNGGNPDNVDDFDIDFNETDVKPNSEPSNSGALDDVELGGSPIKNEKTEYRFTPGSLAVFFMELIGSAFGLAYGAISQAQEIGNPSTPQTISI